MASLGQARQAKGLLLQQLRSAPWLRGIGLTADGADYRLKVNVDALTPEVRAAVPSRCGEVQVEVEVVGAVRALPAHD